MTLRILAATGLAAVLAVNLPAEAGEQSPQISEQKPVVHESRVFAETLEKPSVQKPAKSNEKPAPKADWIWGTKNPADADHFYFRKEFTGNYKTADIKATCDNEMLVHLNGGRVGRSTEWGEPIERNLSQHIQPGKNVIEIDARNAGGVAGLAVSLTLTKADGTVEYVLTDKTWQVAKTKEAEKWENAVSLGKMGRQPWGDVFAKQSVLGSGLKNMFQVQKGFQVEELYTVPKDQQGSWVSITFDNKGRIIASDQGNKGLWRITPAPVGQEGSTKVEKLDLEISSAQGMLYAFDSLYISVNGGPGSGLYRAVDTNGDDQFDQLTKLKALQGGGEHGPHALRLSPDGKSIYLIAGNHTDPPADFDHSRLPKNWSEDLLLPRQWDARGHARGKLAPGGWIAKTDPEGKTWEMVSSGYRNPYDMDFNLDGELFAYDADMEWDMGSPWYRPTRVVHATSGSEFGWRSGTGKWPTWYIDSLPPVVDIGPGSPTGVCFGTGAKFPAKYQKALYLLDWTFGTIHCVHLKAEGSSYTGTKEEFVARNPLPLTDVAIGPDGAMYFTVGGRGTQSALFRVSYIGEESTAPVKPSENNKLAQLRATRQAMGELQHEVGAKAVEQIWPNLASDDRFLGYSSRVALEHQPTKLWIDQAFSSTDTNTILQTMVALSRQGDAAAQEAILKKLNGLDFASLTEFQQLGLLRAYSLCFVRMGKPDAEKSLKIIGQIEDAYPAKTDALNRELCAVLVYLNSPKVVDKTLKLMAAESSQTPEDIAKLIARNAGYGGTIAKMLANTPEIQKIHYALCLRNMRYGWTIPQRKEYFNWFKSASGKSGGASYQGFLTNIQKEAMDNLSPAEKKVLEGIAQPLPTVQELPKPIGPGKDWTAAEILGMLPEELQGRNFEKGKRAFQATRCVLCHRFDGEGGATGPDVTNSAGRFSHKDLVEAITDPSKVISDQYRANTILTAAGNLVTGRIVGEEDGKLLVNTDPFDGNKITKVDKKDIEENNPSKTSMMPKDLLKPLNKEEVLDLIAYLLSRGNPDDLMFSK